MTTISVTRALAQLKQLDDKINRAIQNGVFIDVTVGRDSNKKVYNSNRSVEESSRLIQGSFDQVESLMNNRDELKSKIVLSNATTKVKVAGREITVAEAIELRKTISVKKEFLARLNVSLMTANRTVFGLSEQLDHAINSSLNTILGNDKGKVDEGMYAAIANPQKSQKEPALLDPLKIQDRIKKLEEEIADVDTELDFILSESNARTTIEVSF